jgi:hypothetical protein
VFARFQSKEEHEALTEGMLRARRLRQQIELYRTYRQMGIRTLQQARQYEHNRRQFEKDQKVRKHRESAPHLFQSSQSQSQSQSLGDAADGRRRGRGGGAGDDAAEEYGGGGGGGSMGRSGSSGRLGRSTSGGGGGGGGADDSQDSGGYPPAASASSSSSRGRTGADIPVVSDASILAKAPGGDLLSDMEIQFCGQVGMLPLHYLAAKDAIVRYVTFLLSFSFEKL